MSKHHIGAHHTAVRPLYLHELTSVCELPRADKPSTLKGCIGTLTDGYIRTSTLPRVPTKQSTPPNGKCLPPYFGIPILIPTLYGVIRLAIARVQTPWWFTSLNLITSLCYLASVTILAFDRLATISSIPARHAVLWVLWLFVIYVWYQCFHETWGYYCTQKSLLVWCKPGWAKNS